MKKWQKYSFSKFLSEYKFEKVGSGEYHENSTSLQRNQIWCLLNFFSSSLYNLIHTPKLWHKLAFKQVIVVIYDFVENPISQ